MTEPVVTNTFPFITEEHEMLRDTLRRFIADLRTDLAGDTGANDGPDAVDDIFTINATDSDSIYLLDNDTDLDLPDDQLAVNVTPLLDVQHGTLELHADGTFRYTHDGSENLSDSFEYEVIDSTGNRSIEMRRFPPSGIASLALTARLIITCSN